MFDSSERSGERRVDDLPLFLLWTAHACCQGIPCDQSPKRSAADYCRCAIIVIRPCCPSKISLNRLKMPTQMIGVISTPPNGGMSLRDGAKKGSVGAETRLKGKRDSSTWGYQVKTIRKMKRSVMIASTGPRVQDAIATAVVGEPSNIANLNQFTDPDLNAIDPCACMANLWRCGSAGWSPECHQWIMLIRNNYQHCR